MSAARRRSSFYWGMRLVAEPKRAAMFALYDLARAIDDAADDAGTTEAKRARLAFWRAEIARLYAGQAQAPETSALAPHVARFDLPRVEFDALIDGQEMDLEPVAFDEARLVLYCRRVAGTIGILTLAILGVKADAYAIALGEAFQRINILRDVEEDRARGRSYIPAGADFAAQARAKLAQAEALRAGLDTRALRPALIMTELYRALLAKGRLTKLDKLVAVARGLWASR
jgi:phytoene/squalene synthetase